MSNSEWGAQSSGRIRQLQCLGIRCVLCERNMVPTVLSPPMKPQETTVKGQLTVVTEEEDRDRSVIQGILKTSLYELAFPL